MLTDILDLLDSKLRQEGAELEELAILRIAEPREDLDPVILLALEVIPDVVNYDGLLEVAPQLT